MVADEEIAEHWRMSSTSTLTTAAAPDALAHLRDWIGRSETRHDTVTAQPVAALTATLDRDDPQPKAGDPLPALWHWLYFLLLAPQHEIGDDGHPKRGG